jgi:hypothetical protein
MRKNIKIRIIIYYNGQKFKKCRIVSGCPWEESQVKKYRSLVFFINYQ